MDSSPIAAELSVRNGRQKGARRALKSPVTIIGSTKGCDVRLDVDTVRPIHCLIAVGPDGPCLRSWGANDTFVNDAPCLTRKLRDGDVVRIGPFEFDIHCPEPPPAAEEIKAPVEPVVAGAIPEQVQRLEQLHQQLGEARSRFRRKRTEREADWVRQLQDLAEAREALEQREEVVVGQRTRLLQLRQRFIRRWKRHWSTQRWLISEENARIDYERAGVQQDREALDEAVEQFRAHEQVESRRIEHGWIQLRAAERTASDENARRAAELDRREHAVTEAESRLNHEREALRAERMQMEHRAADLRIEADGLESRVVNLRALLLQVEAQRENAATTAAEPLVPQSVAERASDPADLIERRGALERTAESLTDQQLTLVDQADRLAAVREAWRAEEARLLDDMAGLAEQLRLREAQLSENEKAAGFVQDQLERERIVLKHLRERLEAWQVVQKSIEADWRSELSRRDLEVRQRLHRLEQREAALGELCRRWRERRHGEVTRLRVEHRRCETIRLASEERLAGVAHWETKLDERQRELGAERLTVEKARQLVVEQAGHPEAAKKRLERLGRHVHNALAKAAAPLERSRQALSQERGQLEILLRQAVEQIEAAALDQREAANRLGDLERREFLVTGREALLAEREILWQSQNDLSQRERNNLRDEIDRLAGLFLESQHAETIPLARAA